MFHIFQVKLNVTKLVYNKRFLDDLLEFNFVRYTFLKKKAMVLEAFGKSVEFTNCKVTCQVRLVG